MQSENFVQLTGKLKYPKLSEVGNGYSKFDAKLLITAEFVSDDGFVHTTESYVKIVAWFDVAESLSAVLPGSVVKINGIFQERAYNGKCSVCGAKQRKYWSDVLVYNFVVLDE